MLLPIGFPACASLKRQLGLGETIQSLACNSSQQVMIALSHTGIHFLLCGQRPIFLKKIVIPETAVDRDPAKQVLFSPISFNSFAVITSKRILFYDFSLIDVPPINDAGFDKNEVTLSSTKITNVRLLAELPSENGLFGPANPINEDIFGVVSLSGTLSIVSWSERKFCYFWTATQLIGSMNRFKTSNLQSDPNGSATETPHNEATQISADSTRVEAVENGQPALLKLPFGVIRKNTTRLNQSAGGDGINSEKGRKETVQSENNRLFSLSGSLLYFSVTFKGDFIGFVCSGGEVVLVRLPERNKAKLFLSPDSALLGEKFTAPGASLISINSTHSLIVVATLSGSLLCHQFDPLNLKIETKSWWSESLLSNLKTSVKKNPIVSMSWCADKDHLCVGWYGYGVKVLHFSGVCMFSSSHREMVPELPHWLTSSNAAALSHAGAARGCIGTCWTNEGLGLSIVEPSECRVMTFTFARSVRHTSNSKHSSDLFTPLFFLASDRILLCGNSTSQCSPLRTLYPPKKLPCKSSFQFSGISSDGSKLAIASPERCVVFNRVSGLWLEGDLFESEDRVVTNIVWLSNFMFVFSIFDFAAKRFKLLFVNARSEQLSFIASVELPNVPKHLYGAYSEEKSEGVVCVQCELHKLIILRFALKTGKRDQKCFYDLRVSHMQNITLGPYLNRYLQLFPFSIAKDERKKGPLTKSKSTFGILFLTANHSLVLLNLENNKRQNDTMEEKECDLLFIQKPEGSSLRVFDVWIDCTTPLTGLTFLTYESDQAIYLSHLPLHVISSTARKVLPIRFLVQSVSESGLIPIALSSVDGGIIACQDFHVSDDRPSRLSTSHRLPFLAIDLHLILYAHKVLSALLAAEMPESKSDRSDNSNVGQLTTFVWDRNLFFWLQHLREVDLFIPILDAFLQSVICEKPPGGVPRLDRSRCIQATVSLIRCYAETYKVVVRCVRKVDPSDWHLVLDFFGTPLTLFRDCVERGQLTEAMHLVRIVILSSLEPVISGREGLEKLASSPSSLTTNADSASASELKFEGSATNRSLEDSFLQSLNFFDLLVRNNDFEKAYDVFRFIVLIKEDCNLPTFSDLLPTEASFFPVPDSEEVGLVQHRSERQKSFEPDQNSDSSAQVGEYLKLTLRRLETTNPLSYGKILEKYPTVYQTIESHAVFLYENGLFVQLCRLLNIFSFSVPLFISCYNQKEQERLSSDVLIIESSLQKLMIGFHIEFGLIHSTCPYPPVLKGMLDSDVANSTTWNSELFRDTEIKCWSSAQYILFGNKLLYSCVVRMYKLVSQNSSCKLALDLILMKKAAVMNWLLEQSVVQGNFNRDCCLKHLSVLEHVVENRELLGYQSFVKNIVSSLPPSLFEAPKIR